MSRVSGILLHPTSLPGKYGIGEIGKNAFRFVDYLKEAGQKLWQILPLGPAGYGDSPYSAFSSFAGNELFIDIDNLIELKLLKESDIKNVPNFPSGKVDFEVVKKWKLPILNLAAKNFDFQASAGFKKEFLEFCKNDSYWLDDYSLFMALKEFFLHKSWNLFWDTDIMKKESEAVSRWEKILQKEIDIIKKLQFIFYYQWKNLKNYANKAGIKIIGDIPIFVSPDSADVWAEKEFFQIDEKCQYKSVAGVPPDYFSPTGQRWGNPLYNWEKLEEKNFSWWKKRIKKMGDYVDIIRIDHFRGLRAYWKISAKEKTAEKGVWVKAPGEKLFAAIKKDLPNFEIIAEDLGVITDDVIQLRTELKLPGMKILQFAFEYNEKGKFNNCNYFLPHNCEENSVIYTGTHDNDTTLGWYMSLSDDIKNFIRLYLGRSGDDIVWDFIRVALASNSKYAIFPMQDILGMGSDCRMNIPSTVGDNWNWQMKEDNFDIFARDRLRGLCEMYSRI